MPVRAWPTRSLAAPIVSPCGILCYRLVIGARSGGVAVRVFVTGATGVLGQSAIVSLIAEGHQVTGLARTAEKAAIVRGLGADARPVQLFDLEQMTRALRGFDAVCNLVTHIPVAGVGMRRGSWKVSDRLRTEGSRIVATAAKEAGVRRLVQESVSLLYADGGDDWITEDALLSVTRAVEPSAVAEANAAGFASASHAPVILRFGQLVGDDKMTRWRLSQARVGRSIGVGEPHGWAHVVHPEDAGAAVAAALTTQGGVYNVGAEPVRRDEMTRVFGEVVGHPEIGFMPRLAVKVAGERLEPLTRSHRVCSDKLHEATGWKPVHHVFDPSWISTVAHR
jgi:nucleoside-diphosphate-sugar epimerase